MDESEPPKRAGRVLVIFPGALGDLICAVPAIRAIADRYPAARMELMARAELARFSTGRVAGITRGHSIDSGEIAAMFRENGAPGTVACNFFSGFGVIASFFASGDERFRANLIASAPKADVSFYPFRPDSPGHVASAYLHSVGAQCARTDCSIGFLAGDFESARAVLDRSGLESGRFLMILPGSGSPAKNWPAGRFIELAGRVCDRVRSLVVIGPTEDAIAIEFARAGLPVASDLPLEAVGALARMAAGFVGNDSGVSHLAAAAGGRGIVLFGPTDPARWRPLGNVRILRQNPLEELSVESVISELRLTVGDA